MNRCKREAAQDRPCDKLHRKNGTIKQKGIKNTARIKKCCDSHEVLENATEVMN